MDDYIHVKINDSRHFKAVNNNFSRFVLSDPIGGHKTFSEMSCDNLLSCCQQCLTKCSLTDFPIFARVVVFYTFLKTLDTIGICQRPVFSLVSQHMHANEITYL